MAIPMFLLVLGFSVSYGFLLEGSTPGQNLGLSDKHYLTVIDLIFEERKARQQLEGYVTQLHQELQSKIGSVNGQSDNDTCTDCSTRLQNVQTVINSMKQNFENELQTLKQSLSALTIENTNLKSRNDKLEQDFKNVTQAFTAVTSELTALKQLKALDQGQAILDLQTNSETLKQQMNALANTQTARSHDFLALYNQTLNIKSDISSTNIKLQQLSDYHNHTSQEVHDKLEKIVYESSRNDTIIDNRITSESMARGITYVRWSRKQCPSHAQLIYSGYAGGGRYTETGSSAEPVCLPPDPDFNKTTAGDYGRMYGAEFEYNLFASDSYGQDVPCAVCRVSQASSTIMIPGKHRCYSGWRVEYHGYLASNQYSHAAAGSFVCIDIQPEYVAGGSSWSGLSKLFYGVVAKCGSLKCPPYKQNHPLTCVVCSK